MSGDEAYEEYLREATDEEFDKEFGIKGMTYSDEGQVVPVGGWSVSQKEAIRQIITSSVYIAHGRGYFLGETKPGLDTSSKEVLSVVEHDCESLVERALAELEAITKGDVSK